MKTTLDLLPLSQYVSTSYHAKNLLLALERLQAAHFQKNQNFLTILEQETPFPLSEVLKQLAKAHEVNFNDLAQTESFFSLLRKEISQLPHLTLTVSVNPTLSLIKEINQWVITNLKKPVVLDFVVDETNIGGAKVAFKGKIVDYTVKKLIEPFMKSNVIS